MENNLVIEKMNTNLLKVLKKFQANEMLGYEVYKRLSGDKRLSPENADTLRKIADLEKNHVETLGKYLGSIHTSEKKIERLLLKSKILGFTFTLKRMEMIDKNLVPIDIQKELIREIPELGHIFEEEEMIDKDLLTLLDEGRLIYVSSLVLGLNDALVELSGAIAGFTFAMRNNSLVALAGIITGISASLSMAATEFVATRTDTKTSKKTPVTAAIITGITYIGTVTAMVLPYLLLPDEYYLLALLIMLSVVISIIAIFSFYVSVTNGTNFKRQFGSMALISLSVAFISFILGVVVKNALNIEI
ncbi:MAG: VIT1/CCC1 transporter family protein [Clostridiaceae bacterium]